MQDDGGATRDNGRGEHDDQRRDLLAYGTQVVMDGRLADAERLASRELAERFVREALSRLEDGNAGNGEALVKAIESLDGPGPGVSAVARAGESGVMVHTFTHIGRLTMRLVSSRSVAVDDVRRAFVEAFRVGRHQTHVTARFRTMAVREEILAAQLAGERDYARVRLTEPLKL